MSSIRIPTFLTILLISAAVIGGHLLPGLDNSLVEDGVRDGLHVLVFAVLASIVFARLKSSGISNFNAVSLTMLAAATTAGFSELGQYLTGSLFNVFDVMRDLAGAVLALISRVLWLSSTNVRSSPARRLVSRSAAVLFGLSIVTPFVFWVSIIGLGRLAAPVILDFDEWWSDYLYRPLNAELVTAEDAAGAAEVLLLKRRQSGVIISPMMTDWSGYDYLLITAGMSKGPDTNVTVRLNDTRHRNDWWSDQFLESIVVRDLASIRIPLRSLADEGGQASIDLTDVQEIGIFARDRRRDTVMRIEDIRLE